MIRAFSLSIDDLVCIMTQTVNEATEPVAPNETYEAEDSNGLLNASRVQLGGKVIDSFAFVQTQVMEKVVAQSEALWAPKVLKESTKLFISSDETYHKIKSKLLSAIALTGVCNAV
ncbi:hypothetical protein WISP_09251 [Willisornis vidua]|uniref:Uncharacterized protein n=1 Tax=Willisornis vidua TaxID=1566151 RepID=A0ABQ9DY63_9PASS|nr:hypothetical protein WISP_09251 [Willisornis vidua]